MSREDIQKIIPHREPFVLVDEISDVKFGEYAVGIVKDIGNYDFFSQLRQRSRKSDDLILVDSVRLELLDGVVHGTIENVDSLKELFEGHFPGQPTLPGALTLEALAEIAHHFLLRTETFCQGAFLKRIDAWRFKQVIVPGNEVALRAEQLDVGIMTARAEVNGRTAAQGRLTFVPRQPTASALPGKVTLPGALIVEAMAEVGAVAVLGMEGYRDKLAFLASIDDWQFYLPVVEGQELTFRASVVDLRRSFGKGYVEAMSSEGIVVNGFLIFGLGEKGETEAQAA